MATMVATTTSHSDDRATEIWMEAAGFKGIALEWCDDWGKICIRQGVAAQGQPLSLAIGASAKIISSQAKYVGFFAAALRGVLGPMGGCGGRSSWCKDRVGCSNEGGRSMATMRMACTAPGCSRQRLPGKQTCGVCKAPPDNSRRYRPGGVRGGAWRKIRQKVLVREPDCRACGQPATVVDHIVPRRAGGGNEMGNLQPMCHACHNRKTAAERSRYPVG